MRAHLGCALLALVVLLSESPLHADDARSAALETLPSFVARSDRGDVELARPFEFCITGRYRKGTRVLWPDPLDLGEGFEQVERRIRVQERGANVMSSELCVSLLLFDTGVTEIPGIAVPYDLGTGDALVELTAALPLRVVQGLRAETSTLRAPAAPVEVMIRDWRLIAALVGVCLGAAVLALAWVLRRRTLRKALALNSRPQVELPPDQEALAKLAALESSGALDADELKDCFLAMSEAFRTYLGRRFGFSAMDLTSSEIRSRLASVPGSEAWLKTITAWLSRCDLVKYANTAADADEAREALYGARVLIDRTKEVGHERPREVARA